MAAAEAAVGAAAEWSELVPLSPLRPGTDPPDGSSVHRFAVPPELAGRRVTHLRLNQHPDGGIARMRAWGVVGRDYDTELAAAAVGAVDLLSVLNGARALGCSNRHYGEPRNLIKPGRGANMGAGWETARNLGGPPRSSPTQRRASSTCPARPTGACSASPPSPARSSAS